MPETPPSDPWWRDRMRPVQLLRTAWSRDPRGFAATIAAVLVALGAGVYLAYDALKRPPDVRNTQAVFEPKETKIKKVVKLVNWPRYGYDRGRTRYLAAKGIKPPFKRIWKYGGRPLLEFPPIFVNGRLYGLDNNGHAFSLDADTGKVLWKRRVAQLNASAPVYAHQRIFVTNLVPGQVLALNARSGKTEWKKELGTRTESSPLVVKRRVIFGDESGVLHAVDRRNGHSLWTAQLNGAIKAAPAYQHGILYVGDYGGTMNAVNVRSGKIKWQASSQGLSFGRDGPFYSTPAVAFGRVYSGNNDGRVYSFEAKDGDLAWSHSTGGYVYSSPAVADTPNSDPTVYIGSYDGNLYAIDAKSGDSRWTQSAGGRVIGSVSAVGNIVYVAEFDDTTTTGFAMKDGRKVWEYGTGAYMPVISDGRRIYLTGYSSITGLQPFKPGAGKKKGKKQRAKGGQGSRARRGGASHPQRGKSRSERSKRKEQRQPRRG
ncbi:MAG: PQQ-binding-like beta-propeller repeat protein [Actinomycetota bacterium]